MVRLFSGAANCERKASILGSLVAGPTSFVELLGNIGPYGALLLQLLSMNSELLRKTHLKIDCTKRLHSKIGGGVP